MDITENHLLNYDLLHAAKSWSSNIKPPIMDLQSSTLGSVSTVADEYRSPSRPRHFL